MTPLEDAERQSRLSHIIHTGMRLVEITRDRTMAEYENDITFQWAVDRGLMIVHDYPDIDANEVWRIIHDDLPRLLAEVRALLPPVP